MKDKQHWFEIYGDTKYLRNKQAAVFLDRDGVIIEEKHYIHNPEEVELCPGIVELLKYLSSNEIPVVVVTNQSGISRGIFGWAEYNLVHQRMINLIGLHAPFTAVYANACHPDDDDISWRKPNPGMFFQAAADLNLCLESSLMVGDKLIDLEAAHNAGIKQLVHVKTGHGKTEKDKILSTSLNAVFINTLEQLKFNNRSQNFSKSISITNGSLILE